MVSKDLIQESIGGILNPTGVEEQYSVDTDAGLKWLKEEYDPRTYSQKAKDTALEINDMSYLGSAVKYGQRRLEHATAPYYKDKPFSEFEKDNNPNYGEPSFWEGMTWEKFWGTAGDMGNYITSNPTDFAKTLAMGIVADPWLLGLPGVFGKTFASLTRVASKVGPKVPAMGSTGAAATAAGAEAGVAGGVIAGGEAIHSLERRGSVDTGNVIAGAVGGGILGSLVGGSQAIMKVTKSAAKVVSKATDLPATAIEAEIYAAARIDKISIADAVQQVMGRHQVEGGSDFALQIKQVGEKLAEEATGKYYPIELGPVKATPPPSSTATRLYETAAFKPKGPAKDGVVLTMDEFKQTSYGQSSSGKPLGGAALNARYKQYHQAIADAADQRSIFEGEGITKQELEEIMMDRDPKMREFFLKAGRRKGASTRETKAFKEAQMYGPYVEPSAVRGKRPIKGTNRVGENSPLTRGPQEPSKPLSVKEGVPPTPPPNIPPTPPSGGKLPLGAAAIAALVGYGLNNDGSHPVAWAIAAGGGLLAGAKVLNAISKAHPVARELVSPRGKVRFRDLTRTWQGDTAVYERKMMQLQKSLYEASGGKYKGRKLREQVTLDIDAGKIKNLSPQGQLIAKIAQREFKAAGEVMKKGGLIDDTLENYVTHMWTHSTRSTTRMVEEMWDSKKGGISPRSRSELERTIPTLKLGMDKGLVPRTLDIAEILPLYLKSLQKAQANRQLISSLKELKVPSTNDKVLMLHKDAPKHYKYIDHPQLSKFKAHPDVADYIKSIVGVGEQGAVLRGLGAINFWLKRMAVSLSGFHAKALLMSSLMAGGMEKGARSPIKSTKDLFNMFQGKSVALTNFYSTVDSPTSQTIDLLLRNGLIVNSVDDVGRDTFYASIRDVKNGLDSLGDSIPMMKPVAWMVKQPIRGMEALNMRVDGMMWDRIYTSAKLTTAMDKMRTLTAKYGDTMGPDEIAQMVAEFTNDAFGGLNWLQLAENVGSKYGSKMAYKIASTRGRRNMQLWGFAPDWTTANMRIFYRAFANKNPIQRKLYQAYQLRGMMMWGMAADAVSYSLTGRHMWENDDPFSFYFGDNQSMVLSKQFWEPAKWLTSPMQSALNKTSSLVHVVGENATGKQWLTGWGQYAPPIDNVVTHNASKLAPIWAQQGFDVGGQAGLGAGLKAATFSGAGFPYKERSSLATVGRASQSRNGLSR